MMATLPGVTPPLAELMHVESLIEIVGYKDNGTSRSSSDATLDSELNLCGMRSI